MPEANGRPKFLDAISRAYSDKGKSVVVLTGDTHDLFYCPKVGDAGRFLELEQTVYQELTGKFHVLRMDISSGIEAYDDSDLTQLQKAIAIADGARTSSSEKF